MQHRQRFWQLGGQALDNFPSAYFDCCRRISAVQAPVLQLTDYSQSVILQRYLLCSLLHPGKRKSPIFSILTSRNNKLAASSSSFHHPIESIERRAVKSLQEALRTAVCYCPLQRQHCTAATQAHSCNCEPVMSTFLRLSYYCLISKRDVTFPAPAPPAGNLPSCRLRWQSVECCTLIRNTRAYNSPSASFCGSTIVTNHIRKGPLPSIAGPICCIVVSMHSCANCGLRGAVAGVCFLSNISTSVHPVAYNACDVA